MRKRFYRPKALLAKPPASAAKASASRVSPLRSALASYFERHSASLFRRDSASFEHQSAESETLFEQNGRSYSSERLYEQ
jgi:hypothetical protein